MMSPYRRFIALVLLVSYTAACADVTLPDYQQAEASTKISAGNVGPSSTYILDPIGVVVPRCDPFLDPNFCLPEVCITEISPALGEFSEGTFACGTGPRTPGGGGLPGDTDDDGDTWDQGPGAWILCVTTVLGTVAGGAGSYFALEDYYHKLENRDEARLRLQMYFQNGGGASGPEYLELTHDLDDAEREARNALGLAASAIGVSVLSLVGAGLVCAPLIIAPTP